MRPRTFGRADPRRRPRVTERAPEALSAFSGDRARRGRCSLAHAFYVQCIFTFICSRQIHIASLLLSDFEAWRYASQTLPFAWLSKDFESWSSAVESVQSPLSMSRTSKRRMYTCESQVLSSADPIAIVCVHTPTSATRFVLNPAGPRLTHPAQSRLEAIVAVCRHSRTSFQT